MFHSTKTQWNEPFYATKQTNIFALRIFNKFNHLKKLFKAQTSLYLQKVFV